MKHNYIRKETYSIEAVLEQVHFVGDKKSIEVNFDGDDIYLGSMRYQNFKLHGVTCARCGIIGEYFIKERSPGKSKYERYHFNLYGHDARGNEVMLTRDHIIPLSKGGPDTLENSQVLCERCNSKKGNLLEAAVC